MLPRITKVEYLEGYKLKLTFQNGKIKVVDLEERLKHSKNLFLDLLDLDYFKQVTCDGYSIVWPNGIDFCPYLLYKMGKNLETKPATMPKKRRRKTSTRKRAKTRI